jgi:GNAT superfamily N-acetyltransferase
MKGYRIRRVEDADPVIDLRSMLRRVFGRGPEVRRPRQPKGGITFEAIVEGRMVGSITLHKPDPPAAGGSRRRAEVATLQCLDVEPAQQDLGCREALLDVAQQWARASEYGALEVVVPSVPAGDVDFYLANGFHIVGGTHDSGADAMSVVLSLPLAEAQPHTDAWYSKHHGAWFASIATH